MTLGGAVHVIAAAVPEDGVRLLDANLGAGRSAAHAETLDPKRRAIVLGLCPAALLARVDVFGEVHEVDVDRIERAMVPQGFLCRPSSFKCERKASMNSTGVIGPTLEAWP
jgi:hypothetical protein